MTERLEWVDATGAEPSGYWKWSLLYRVDPSYNRTYGPFVMAVRPERLGQYRVYSTKDYASADPPFKYEAPLMPFDSLDEAKRYAEMCYRMERTTS